MHLGIIYRTMPLPSGLPALGTHLYDLLGSEASLTVSRLQLETAPVPDAEGGQGVTTEGNLQHRLTALLSQNLRGQLATQDLGRTCGRRGERSVTLHGVS